MITIKDKTQIPIATEYLLKRKLKDDGCLDRGIVLEIARCHCECMDGSGYPKGLFGNQIPLAARLVGFASRLDEMLTGRGGEPGPEYFKDGQIYAEERRRFVWPGCNGML